MANDLDLSVVVPLYNEEVSVRPLVDSISEALADRADWELILVDDGSADATVEIAASLACEDHRIRVLPLARNYGQTAAMQAGFDHASGRVVVSMDGDLQNDPRDIPRLVEELTRGYDLVVGYRERRKDKLITRKIPSRVANAIIRWITGIEIRDNGCSLKAYRRDLLDRIRLYSDMHRFIPAIAAGITGARITEIPVRHHPRRFGTSKYGLSRVFKVLADLLAIQMIRFFRERPLIMFSFGASIAVLLGFVFAVATGVSLTRTEPEMANSLVLPGAALLWWGLACYLFMLGLLGEIAVHQDQDAGEMTHRSSVSGRVQ